MLQRRGGSPVPGPGQKANDSFDMLFDTTACGEYKSYNGSQLGQSHACEEEEEEEEDDGNPSIVVGRTLNHAQLKQRLLFARGVVSGGSVEIL